MEDGGAPPFLLVTMPRLNRELGASLASSLASGFSPSDLEG